MSEERSTGRIKDKGEMENVKCVTSVRYIRNTTSDTKSA
jgi:hypothetical protein